MRRFSQRNSLVTLNEINITPLLDLAFVLLIIFIIMSPSIRSQHEQGMPLTLPKGGAADVRRVSAKDLRIVSVDRLGRYQLGNQFLPWERVAQSLAQARRANPDLIVRIRGDANGAYKWVAQVLSFCQQNEIAVDLRTQP